MNRLATLVFAILFLSGCATSIKTSNEQTASGLRYYLPYSAISAETTRTSITTNAYNFTSAVDPKLPYATSQDSVSKFIEACYEVDSKVKEKVELKKLDILTLPDQSKSYSVSLDPGFFSGGDLSISRSSNGLLRSIKIKDEGKLGESIVNGVKTVASVAGAFAGFQPVAPIPKPMESVALPKSTGVNKGVPETCQEWRTKIRDEYKIKGFDELPVVRQVALLSDSKVRSAFSRLPSVTQKLKKYRDQIEALEQTLAKAKYDIFIETKERIAALLDIEANNKALLEGLQTVITNKETEINKTKKLGEKSKPTQHHAILKIEELKASSCLSPLPQNCGIPELDDLGVTIVLDSLAEDEGTMPEGTTAEGTTPEGTTPEGTTPEDTWPGTDKPYIAYRDPRPYRIAAYVMDGTENKKIKDELVSLFTRKGLTGHLPFETSISGDRSMTLEFSDSGALIDVKYEYTSAGAALAGAAYNASTGALESYKAGLTSVYEINEAKRKEGIAEINFSVDQLKKEKERVEAEIALSTSETDAASALELKSINDQIALLEAEQDLLLETSNLEQSSLTLPLANQQAILDAQLNTLKSQAALDTYSSTQVLTGQQALLAAQLSLIDSQTSINNKTANVELKAMLETLKLKVELLQQQIELDDLKKN